MSASAAGPEAAPAPWDLEEEGGPEPARPARHDAFTPARRRIFLKHLAKTGCIADAARLTGVGKRTIYNHQERDEAFARHCDIAVRMAGGGIEQVAYERAVAGVPEQFACGGKVYTRTRYSDGLLRLLLQGTSPKKYGPRPGFTRKRLVKAERKRMREEVEAEFWAKQRSKEDVMASILRKIEAIEAHAEPEKLAAGWSKTEDGHWVPPGWVRDPNWVPPPMANGEVDEE